METTALNTIALFDGVQARALQMRQLLRNLGAGCRQIQRQRHSHIYSFGDVGDSAYLLEEGQVKLLTPTLDGEEGVVDILTPGEIFGESGIFQRGTRVETAVAMTDSKLLQIPHYVITGKPEGPLLESLLFYLLERETAQQQMLAALSAARKQDRLALALLYLARKIGRLGLCDSCIEIRQEELADMTGMRRTRIGVFLKRFRQIGIIRLNARGKLVISEEHIVRYLKLIESQENNYINIMEEIREDRVPSPKHVFPGIRDTSSTLDQLIRRPSNDQD